MNEASESSHPVSTLLGTPSIATNLATASGAPTDSRLTLQSGDGTCGCSSGAKGNANGAKPFD